MKSHVERIDESSYQAYGSRDVVALQKHLASRDDREAQRTAEMLEVMIEQLPRVGLASSFRDETGEHGDQNQASRSDSR